MKKKFTLILLTLVCALACVLGLAACGEGENNSSGGNSNIQQPPEHTHSPTLVAAKPATCTENGNMAYYTCTCDKWFLDASAMVAIIDKTYVTLNATGHSYSTAWEKDQTEHWHKATCAHTSLTTEKENHIYNNNGQCTTCGYQDTSLHGTEIASDVFAINGSDLYVKIPNSQTTFSFLDAIRVADGATFVVATDEAISNLVYTKKPKPAEGDNTYYVYVINGQSERLYTTVVHRCPIYTVTFDTDGGTAVDSQQIEEDNKINAPAATTKTGYTFVAWQINGENVTFPYTITENTTIVATWQANEYKATFDVNGGNALETMEQTVTYDSAYQLPAPTRTNYSFSGWYDGSTQLTNASGASLSVWNYAQDKTLTAKWEADVYTLTALSDNTSAGSVTGGGNYVYDSTVTLTATTNNGYTFIGWYDGETELTKESSYTFTMPAESVTYTAKWQVAAEMENFYFTFTATTCTITGIKDNTVTEIIVPAYVTSIGGSAFSGCSSLESITLPFVGGGVKTASDTYQYPFGYIFGTNSYTGSVAATQWYYGSSTSGTTADTFYIPSSLKSVTITGGNILWGAFSWCSSLTSVTIGNSVTSIGNCAFYNCSGLTSVTIPESVTSIGGSAFYNCSGLTSITIPNSVTSIGDEAFHACSSLTIYCEAPGKPSGWVNSWNSSCPVVWNCKNNEIAKDGYIYTMIDGLRYSLKDGVAAVLLQPRSINGAIEIPASITYKNTTYSVTSIVEEAFRGCSGLTSITIPNSVTSIGKWAFVDCSNLQYNVYDNAKYLGNRENPYLALIQATNHSIASCEINENTKVIYDDAFDGCSGLTSITIPSGVTSIEGYAFDGCSGLTSITIPNSVTSIWNWAFNGCSGLTRIDFNGTKAEWKAISKGSYWDAGTGNYTVHCTDGDIAKANS